VWTIFPSKISRFWLDLTLSSGKQLATRLYIARRVGCDRSCASDCDCARDAATADDATSTALSDYRLTHTQSTSQEGTFTVTPKTISWSIASDGQKLTIKLPTTSLTKFSVGPIV